MKSKFNILLLALAVIALGYLVYHFGQGGAPAPQAKESAVSISREVREAIGTVAGISGKEITLSGVQKMPLTSETASDSRGSAVVTVSATTGIERLVPKSADVVEKERAAFEKEAQTASSTSARIPPEPFTRKKISLADIRVGDFLLVSADADITHATAFTAAHIDVLPAKQN